MQKVPIKKYGSEQPKKKNVHEGHRERVFYSFNNDTDFTTFSDHEILEYLLFFGIPYKDTNPIAHELIERFGSLSAVLHAAPEDLFEVSGMTKNAARLLPAILPAARKAEMSRVRESANFGTVDAAVEYLSKYFMGKTYECFYLASLDVNDKLIQVDLISSGVVDSVRVNARKIITHACRNNAAKIIIAHNHPAGSVMPSESDYRATVNIVTAATAIGMTFVDHIIYSGDSYLSFYHSRLLDKPFKDCDKIFETDIGTKLDSATRYKAHLTEYLLEGVGGKLHIRSLGDDSDGEEKE